VAKDAKALQTGSLPKKRQQPLPLFIVSIGGFLPVIAGNLELGERLYGFAIG